MQKNKEETGNRRALAGKSDSQSPLIGCESEYITAALDLQEEIKGKFTPKRKRAGEVANLYGAVGERFRPPGRSERKEREGVDMLDGVPFTVNANAEVRFAHPVEEYAKLVGEKKCVETVYELMCHYPPDRVLSFVSGLCFRWYERHSENVDECGTYLEFHMARDRAALHHANFCRDRLCPLCNWRRSLKVFGQVSKVMEELDKENYRYLFLTLTVRNVWGDELTDAVQALYDGWRVLYHDYIRVAASARTVEKRLKGIVKGTFRVLEVTVSDGEYSPDWAGSFHPHLHVILAVNPSYYRRGHYLDTSEWSDIWRKACGLNYAPSVKIEAVRPKLESSADVAGMERGAKTISYAGAVAELSKYPMKDADYNRDADFGEERGQYLSWVVHALRGRRLVGMTGRFKEIAHELSLDDMENGDLVHVDPDELSPDLNYLVVKYHWRCGVYEPFVYRPTPDEESEDGVYLEKVSSGGDWFALQGTELKERRKRGQHKRRGDVQKQ